MDRYRWIYSHVYFRSIGSKIRVVTLEMALNVLRHLIGLTDQAPPSGGTKKASSTGGEAGGGCLRDQHLAALEGAKEEATLLLRNFYKVKSFSDINFFFFVE